MRFMNQYNKPAKTAAFFMTILLFLLLCPSVYAASHMSVAETYTGESEVILYVKGADGDLSDVRVQAGTAVCDSVTQTRLSESSQTVKTLIMLDNSLSIPKTDRKQISKILRNIISKRMEQEEMALAVFNDGIVYLADYTADEQELLKAAESIEYQSSNTYLTDVLYDLLSAEYVQKKEDMFLRILVISDGMDNKSIGYTKDELSALLKEYPVPVYTVGIQTGKKDNNEQLENMFAISRLTGAESFLLDGKEVLSDIGQAFGEAGSIIRFTVRPPQELMDGSRKTVKITFADNESISAEVVMPQQVKTAETQPDDEAKADQDRTEGTGRSSDQGQAEGTGGSSGQDQGKGTSSNKRMTVILVLLCLLAAAAAVTVPAVLAKRKRKDPQPDAEEETDLSQTAVYEDGDKTVVMEMPQEEDEEGTVLMGNEGVSFQMILTDVSSGKVFQAPLGNSAVIGRKQEACDVTIGYDRSVSGRHCKITVRDGRFFISDLQSSNGTFVGGSRVVGEAEIVQGSVIRMGKTEVRFEVRCGSGHCG